MQRRILLAGAIMSLSAMLASAQSSTSTPPTTEQIVAHQVARLTKLLDLTAAEQTQATTIFTTEQTALAGDRTSMQTARAALKTAIKNNDTAAIGTQSTQIGTLTGQQILAESSAAAAFYAILTADQQSKFDTLGPMLGGPGGPGRPGGFGGPRGFGGSH